MRRVLKLFNVKVACPLPYMIPESLQLLFNFNQMKNILPRNLFFPGFLILLLVQFIFHSSGQFLTPQTSPGKDESFYMPGNTFSDFIHISLKSFIVRNLSENSHTSGDIIHFQHYWLYPFSPCCVYRVMKKNIIAANDPKLCIPVHPYPCGKDVFYITNTSYSKIYTKLNSATLNLTIINCNGINNDIFNF